jgi:carboxyl-terminal processing protease
MRKLVLSLLLCSAVALGATARHQGANAHPASANIINSLSTSQNTLEQYRETFNIVWQTVKEKHFDPSFGGVDWDKVRDQYAPRVATLKSDHELYELLQQMLGELGQSHFNIYPPGSFVEEDERELPTGTIGIDLQILDGLAVMTRVDRGSPGARAGLRPGFVVKQVDETPVSWIIERFAQSKESPERKLLRMARVIRARIGGAPGTSVRIVYLDGRDQPREVKVEREKFTGELSPRLGNFPPQYMEFESKRLAGGIGYIRFNFFVVPMMEKIRAALRTMSDAPGLIFDLRGNPGGVGGMAPGIAGRLETKQTSLGTMKLRAGYVNVAVFPQADPYTGPVVILIDGGSGSTSEVFAAGMQEIGRAVVVGERSVGAALPSIFSKLPTGALFQYAVGDFQTPKGVLIEGRGVVPDVEVKLSRRALLDGRDPQLEAAIDQIKKRANR